MKMIYSFGSEIFALVSINVFTSITSNTDQAQAVNAFWDVTHLGQGWWSTTTSSSATVNVPLGGLLTVADEDVVVVHHLSKQFLYHKYNVG
ncbi:hypothetical protein L1887_05560 [Cichorium endivia]|nr:hypothetical protein L1887_05560 [Cichorium endivia]